MTNKEIIANANKTAGTYIKPEMISKIYEEVYLKNRQDIIDIVNKDYKPKQAREINMIDIRMLIAKEEYGFIKSNILEAVLLVLGIKKEEIYQYYSEKEITAFFEKRYKGLDNPFDY